MEGHEHCSGITSGLARPIRWLLALVGNHVSISIAKFEMLIRSEACRVSRTYRRDGHSKARESAGTGDLGPNLRICYLKSAFDEIKSRLENRHGNFARETILAGQFVDLEAPGDSVLLRAS